MAKINVISIGSVYLDFGVELVRGFRVLHNKPKCWREVTSCKTSHGPYESGVTTIYQSTNTKKYYMVRYFDGCFSEMYAETEGINWDELENTMREIWKENPFKRKDLTKDEKFAKRMELIEKAEKAILGMVG